MGAAMNVSIKMFHRVCLPSAIAFVVVLIIGSALSAPPQAATKETVQQSRCTRRVTVTSKPCGAKIYIDGIEVGRTPMSFPMPTGGYTLVLLAPGHQAYAQRILVPDAPIEIQATMVPLK
jgi:hypothetical protein